MTKHYKVDMAVNIELPEEVLMAKLLGRRTCDICKGNFNVADIRDGACIRGAACDRCVCVVCSAGVWW